MPRISPIAQPVRQCSVALIAVRQVLSCISCVLWSWSMVANIYPPGVSAKVMRTTMQLVAYSAADGHSDPVALEHALLVSLSERPAAGLELARRFDRSIGI